MIGPEYILTVVLMFGRGVFPGLCGYLEVLLGTLFIIINIKDCKTV
jgi:hypothetical protein